MAGLLPEIVKQLVEGLGIVSAGKTLWVFGMREDLLLNAGRREGGT